MESFSWYLSRDGESIVEMLRKERSYILVYSTLTPASLNPSTIYSFGLHEAVDQLTLTHVTSHSHSLPSPPNWILSGNTQVIKTEGNSVGSRKEIQKHNINSRRKKETMRVGDDEPKT